MRSVKERFVFFPRLLFSGLMSPLSDVVVENPHLLQKVDPFGHNHGVGYFLTSLYREFSPHFQFFDQLGKGFRGVIGPHCLHCILLKVDFFNCPVAV